MLETPLRQHFKWDLRRLVLFAPKWAFHWRAR